jgi:class 3 adenylate cyclase/tetratricopeptide (TPR) repeat protein
VRCGTALSETCPACGRPVGSEFEFCPACGTRLGEAPARSADELKTVTILFSDWVGSTTLGENLDPEALRHVQERYFDQARAIIRRHGGTVEKFIGDAVMAVFGVPQVHEDDALRAARAAVELRDALTAINERLLEQLGVRIATRTGVNTGEVVAGDPAAGQTFVTGDPVVVAKRLEESAAPGEILIGETTFGLTRDAVLVEPVPDLVLKGKRASVQAWRLIAIVHGAQGHVRRLDQKIVNRERELELLRNTFTLATRDRAPQLITLVGVPGVGKTRLVSEFAVTLDGSPEAIVWHAGHCMPYGEAASLAALAEIARSSTGIYENEGYEAAAAKLRASVDSLLEPAEARWVERHLRPLIGLPDDPDQQRDGRGEAFAAWSRFLESFAERSSLVLLFEDLHWAGDDLLDFVEHFVGWATDVPVVVIATTRPELIERRPGWGAGKRNALTVSLAPLSNEHTRELLVALLEEAPFPAVTDALVVRSEGNPFYAEEFVRMLAERGLLGRPGDVAGGDRHGDLPLPESVQGIIAARLDALSASEKSLLQDAAVVGKVFWVGAVAAIGGLDPALVEAQLRGLEAKEFVRRERRSSMTGETQYAFLHALVRDVAYGQIPRTSRAERHQRAARWLESPDTADRPEIRAEMLAHHYLSALEYARPAGPDRVSLEAQARSALVEAGDRAHALHAHAAAEHLYSVALDIAARDDEGRPELLFKYGRSRFHSAEQGAEELTEAAELLLAQGSRELAAEAEMMLCALLVSQGDRVGAIGRLEHANELVSSAGPSRSKAYVLATSARYRMLAAQDDEAVRLGGEALAMSQLLGLDDVSAQALNNIGVSRVALGDDAGIDDLERAISIAREINSPEIARGYRFLASVVAISGDLERSYELFAEGRRAAERFADAHNARPLAASYVGELYWRGEWDEAVARADSFIEESRAGSPHYHEIPCRRVRGQIRLAREDPAGALEDADVGLAFARTARDPWFLNGALAFRARALLSEGHADEAASLVDELLGLLHSPRRLGLGGELFELSVVLVDLGRGEELARLVGGLQHPTRWAAAAGAFARGDFSAAARAYAEIGARPDEAFARLRLAKQLVERGFRDDAESNLRLALAFYEQVGATAFLRDAEAVIASMGNRP